MKKPDLNVLSLREKIGQTAVAYCHNDFSNPENKQWGALYVNSNMRFNEFNARFENSAEDKKGAHYEDWIELIEKIDEQYKIPILAVGDNETGLHSSLSGFSRLTTSLLLGAADDEELAYKAGYARGLQMRCAGIRWIWGPVVDLGAWKSAIASRRQFSDNADRTIRLAKAMIKGSMDAGVAPTIKHFPGDGPVENRDSHATAIVNYLSVEEWEEKQGKVYREIIASGIPSIMVGHTGFPAIDPSMVGGGYRPATISYPIITEFLKGKLGFKGAVVTDALSMRSVVTALDESMERVYIEAFKAGNDFMLGCEDDYIDCIEKAVLNGEISMERVDDACQRALNLKECIGMFEEGYKAVSGDFDEVAKYCAENNAEIADKGINLVCDRTNLLPVKAENIKKVTIIYVCPRESVRKEYKHIENQFEKRGAKVTVYETLTSREMMKEIADDSDLIVYLAHYDVNGSFVDPEYMTFYYALVEGSDKSVVINTSDHTMYYEFFSCFPVFINAFMESKEVLEKVVEKIYGESEFKGICPFSLYPPQVEAMLKGKPYGLIEW